jgi:hypothetical protein
MLIMRRPAVKIGFADHDPRRTSVTAAPPGSGHASSPAWDLCGGQHGGQCGPEALIAHALVRRGGVARRGGSPILHSAAARAERPA